MFFNYILIIIMFLIGFIFPYFCGISLNSRAGLEFKEFRLFSAIIEKRKFNMFFRKIIVEKAKPIIRIFLKKTLNFNIFVEK